MVRRGEPSAGHRLAPAGRGPEGACVPNGKRDVPRRDRGPLRADAGTGNVPVPPPRDGALRRRVRLPRGTGETGGRGGGGSGGRARGPLAGGGGARAAPSRPAGARSAPRAEAGRSPKGFGPSGAPSRAIRRSPTGRAPAGGDGKGASSLRGTPS